MKLINTTPHTINIFDESGQPVASIKPSGIVFRCEEQRVKTGAITVDGAEVATYSVVYGAVTAAQDGEEVEVPAAQEGVVYIVSALVKAAAGRDDFFSPGSLIRNEAGQPVGCKGLNA